ncbi:hypothetical protein RYA99_12235 [Pseudomonas syringae pv. actinidifoliorum]|nr:hypothetical protein [Pseudomonas syringae pv. actinidifoliorum]MDU8520077.1 hypothetical protein [Pseudomonas syringae pv. actinidifoliorum]MDU8526946.1 hypothetical protein [Pseudomonas syringae pv. actinidifoliorum]
MSIALWAVGEPAILCLLTLLAAWRGAVLDRTALGWRGLGGVKHRLVLKPLCFPFLDNIPLLSEMVYRVAASLHPAIRLMVFLFTAIRTVQIEFAVVSPFVIAFQFITPRLELVALISSGNIVGVMTCLPFLELRLLPLNLGL